MARHRDNAFGAKMAMGFIALCVLGLLTYALIAAQTKKPATDDTPAGGGGGGGSGGGEYALALGNDNTVRKGLFGSDRAKPTWTDAGIAFDFSEFAVSGKNLCGINPKQNNTVYCTSDWTVDKPQFKAPGGSLRNLSLSGTSLCGADAIPSRDQIFCSTDFNTKGFTQVNGSGIVTAQGNGKLCVVSKDNKIFCTDSIVQNPVWTKRGDLAVDIAMNETGGMCALNPDGSIFCQENLSGIWTPINTPDKKNVNLATNIHGKKMCIFNSDKVPAFCHDSVFSGDKAGWYGLSAAGSRIGLEKV